MVSNTASVSPLSHVHPNAQIGHNVVISPFCYIDSDVVIGDNTHVGPNVTIFDGARIGKHCRIFPGGVISAIPQDLKFEEEVTTAEIGDYTTIRECVTINRGTKASWKTSIGSHCLIMAYVHVAHDCCVGNHVILANSVNLAGHVTIEDWAILEGLVAVQQFIAVGAHSFIAGGSLVRKNVPPYVKAAREPLSYAGVNSVGLSRRGYNKETITHIQDIYRPIFVSGLSLNNALNYLHDHIADSVEKQTILHFINSSSIKGIIKGFASVNNGNGDNNES